MLQKGQKVRRDNNHQRWSVRIWPFLCLLFLVFGSRIQPAVAQVTVPTVSCRLDTAVAPVGGQAELWVEIQNVQDFSGYELALTFDPNLVELLDSDPNRELINAQLGDFLSPDLLTANDLVPPQLLLDVAQGDASPDRAGNGLLARITVRARQSGTANFSLDEVFLYDGADEEIAHETQGCSWQITGDSAPTPTMTAVSPTAAATAPSAEATASETPTPSPPPPAEMTATASPPPVITFEPTPSPLPASATVAPVISSDTPTPIVVEQPLQPTATASAPITDGGVLPLPTPVSLPQEVVTPTPTLLVTSPLSTPAENSGGVNPLTDTLPVTSVVTGGAPSLPLLSAAQLEQNRHTTNMPTTGSSYYLIIFVMGLLALGLIGFELLLLVSYVLVLRLRWSQRNSPVRPQRRSPHDPRR